MRFSKPYTLVIDIGGSGIKMLVADAKQRPVTERLKESTPASATPRQVFALIKKMITKVGTFQRVSVGFPGVMRNGVIGTAVNLGPGWVGMNLAKRAAKVTGKPTLATNDANLLGLSVIRKKGVEMLLTLGTGMGSAIYIDGIALPNLELGHHPFRKDKTYEDVIGKAGLQRLGVKKWNKELETAIELMQSIFVFDRLYIGGGYSRQIRMKLPKNVEIIDQTASLCGGVLLWD